MNSPTIHKVHFRAADDLKPLLLRLIGVLNDIKMGTSALPIHIIEQILDTCKKSRLIVDENLKDVSAPAGDLIIFTKPSRSLRMILAAAGTREGLGE